MPSVSEKQARFMRQVAKNPVFAQKVGVSQRVGEEFLKADEAKKQPEKPQESPKKWRKRRKK